MGMLCIILTVFVLFVIMMRQSEDLTAMIRQYDDRVAALERRIEEEHDRTEEIEKLRAYMETDAYIEQIAREKLGLVKDNEIVFEEEN